MAINWNFDSNDVEEGFPLIPAGDHRVRIAATTEKQSKSGNDMIEISLDISNYPGHLFYHLVFMPDNTTMTNTNLKRLWESFGIEPGNLNSASWVGKVGGCRVKHEQYNGDTQAKVSYFLDKKKQESLPAWVEKSSGGAPVSAGGSQTYSDPDWMSDAPNDPPFEAGDLPL